MPQQKVDKGDSAQYSTCAQHVKGASSHVLTAKARTHYACHSCHPCKWYAFAADATAGQHTGLCTRSLMQSNSLHCGLAAQGLAQKAQKLVVTDLLVTDLLVTDLVITDLLVTDLVVTDLVVTDLVVTDLKITDLVATDMKITDVKPELH